MNERGEKCMTKSGMEGDEGNGFERHWKVGMKMGSGCEWCMSWWEKLRGMGSE